jgi:hypothetical protein
MGRGYIGKLEGNPAVIGFMVKQHYQRDKLSPGYKIFGTETPVFKSSQET